MQYEKVKGRRRLKKWQMLAYGEVNRKEGNLCCSMSFERKYEKMKQIHRESSGYVDKTTRKQLAPANSSPAPPTQKINCHYPQRCQYSSIFIYNHPPLTYATSFKLSTTFLIPYQPFLNKSLKSCLLTLFYCSSTLECPKTSTSSFLLPQEAARSTFPT